MSPFPGTFFRVEPARGVRSTDPEPCRVQAFYALDPIRSGAKSPNPCRLDAGKQDASGRADRVESQTHTPSNKESDG